MELILTHNNMDFDSLAAEFGVSKLHTNARMVLGYPLVGNVRNFLALYRSSLPIAQMKYVDLDQVSRLFIVDCQDLDRLDDHAKKLITDPTYKCPYTIFDHHQSDPDSLSAGASEDSVIERVGAATTILVDQIRRKKISLTPFEATLLAIGIYEDTGCLTYSGTTEKDAICVSYLLKHGADLSIVNDYIRPKLSDEQLGLMEDLVKNARTLNIGGARIIISTAERVAYLDGLASLTRKLTEITSADAAFTAVFMRDRIHVVGRSDTPSVDVRSVVRKFGGDGHHGAGSAVVRKSTVAEVCETIETVLQAQVIPEKTAEEIMVAPVRTIKSSITMDEASRVMLRYGLDGLLVSENDKIVGVVSRRDIDQATHHKLGHAPVVGFMSRPVISISPRTSLSKIQEIMVREDIGRLPVLDSEEQLVGLVSRQDVLKTLYGSSDDFVIPEWANTIKKDFAASGQMVRLEKRLVDMQEKMATLDGPTLWLC
ncbi:MAG TPA: CBS domain-containing protein, partial [Chroococcales cyanobacterium]